MNKKKNDGQQPTVPVAPYIGGKRHLAKTIIQHINRIPHKCYAEAFVGMGGVFLRRPQAASVEVINDYNKDVANFFRVLQRHYIAFLELMRFQLTTRVEFERLSKTNPDTLTDLERAARFLYLQRTGFGGKVLGQVFGVSADHASRFNITRLEPMLEEVHIRMAGVVIECLPYAEFIRRYDKSTTLFYLDPPYVGYEDYYGPALFEKDDFPRLAELLRGLKGRFLLSLNDTPAVRKWFSGFQIKKVATSYSVSSGSPKRLHELLIANA